MTPVAAYYLYLANENERTSARKVRVPGPSLVARLRGMAAALRTKRSIAHPA